ncbi:MAG: M20/M25/M40 family metallo-hydrolase, partial [Ilumatobacteraceae bacterium]
NATVELAELVLDLVALSDVSVGTTVSPTVASSGTTRNTVPDRAVLYVDVRAWTSSELERVDSAIRTRMPAVDGVTIEVSGGVNRGPMQPGQADELVRLARQAASDVGMGEVGAVAVGGASDGNLTAALGIPTLDGLGADGGGAHSDHEWVDVASLVQRARWVARVIDLITAPR